MNKQKYNQNRKKNTYKIETRFYFISKIISDFREKRSPRKYNALIEPLIFLPSF